MKIQNQSVQLDAYVKAAAQGKQTGQAKNKNPQQQVAVRGDKVDISHGSKLLNKVNQAMKAEEPQRAAKVQQIKEQVQSGNYKVQPDKVANAMLSDLIKDLG